MKTRFTRLIPLLFLFSSIAGAQDESKLPFTFKNACRLYFEALNPFSAARELHRRGEFEALLHPIRTLRRSDSAYIRARDSEHNRHALALEKQLLAQAELDGTVPVHFSDTFNRAMAKNQKLQYHVVIKKRRAFFTADEGFEVFPRGWALFLDPKTKIVLSILGPHGETDVPSRLPAGDPS
jgi:hypothetical protein